MGQSDYDEVKASVLIDAPVIKKGGVAISRSAAEINLLVQGIAAGYKVARGVDAVTGTLDKTTGLTTVVAFVAVLAEDPALTGHLVTFTLPAQSGGTAGHVTIKVWKPTAANDCTPIAATVAKNVAWSAIGT